MDGKMKGKIVKSEISKRFCSAATLCYYELPVFTAYLYRLSRFESIERSFKKVNIRVPPRCIPTLKPKRNYQYITTLFYKKNTRKTNRPRVLSFLIILILRWYDSRFLLVNYDLSYIIFFFAFSFVVFDRSFIYSFFVSINWLINLIQEWSLFFIGC